MTPPQISTNVLSLDFGDEVAGKLSQSQTVVVTNTGGEDLIISDIEFIGAAPVDFGLTSDFCSFQVLAAGESCEVSIGMRATELGDRFAEFVIESNDPEEPLWFLELSGKGTGSGGCHLNPWAALPGNFSAGLFLLLFFWAFFRTRTRTRTRS